MMRADKAGAYYPHPDPFHLSASSFSLWNGNHIGLRAHGSRLRKGLYWVREVGMARPFWALALLFGAAVAHVEVQNAPAPQPPGRVNTVYLTVTHEESGAAVLDLTSADVVVKEDGKDR